jgi:tRNA A-37 threonylcarbamoyl transferase component Bud32
LYYQPLQIQRHLKREADGSNALINAGIATAQLLYVGKARNAGIGVLVLEYIHPVSHLEEVWNALENLKEKRQLLCRLMVVVAKMHEAGLRQRDLHLNNFLLRDHMIYSVDGARVEKDRLGRPLDISDSLDNLALLFSQFSLQDTVLVRDVLPDYARVRGWKCDANVSDQLGLKIERFRSRRIRKYLKKIFRESTAIIVRKSFGSYILCKRAYHTSTIETLLDNPDWFLDRQKHLLLKRGNTSTVARIRIGDHDLVVKRYNMKDMVHRLRRCFRKTRAANSWRNAHLLLLLGISTPEPIAVLEKRFGPFRGTAYFISQYVDGPHAAHFFDGGDLYEKRAVAQNIAEILKKLKLARITHGDMKATNLIVHQEQPVLTDLDAMHLHTTHRRFAHAYRKDIDRFFQNWKAAPDVDSLFKELVCQ